MKRKLLLCMMWLSLTPAHAVEIEVPPTDPTTPPQTVIVLKDEHPKVYKASALLRAAGRGIKYVGRKTGVNQTLKFGYDLFVWTGQKSQPIQPGLNLFSSMTNAAISTGVWFKR